MPYQMGKTNPIKCLFMGHTRWLFSTERFWTINGTGLMATPQKARDTVLERLGYAHKKVLVWCARHFQEVSVSLCDAGRTLKPAWFNVSLFAGDTNPASTRRWNNAGLMLGHRLRRWLNIKPSLSQRLVSSMGQYWSSRLCCRVADLGQGSGSVLGLRGKVGVQTEATDCTKNLSILPGSYAGILHVRIYHLQGIQCTRWTACHPVHYTVHRNRTQNEWMNRGHFYVPTAG